jgi:NAD-dependent deacetylase
MITFDKTLADAFKNAEKIVFFTGAGISAESGIPTFRGKDGLWNKMKPEELASFDAFIKNPELVWEWYQYRRKIIHNTSPNPGHLIISKFQNIFPSVTVVTQNVDNLHRRAGSKTIFELHGNIERNFCVNCKEYYNEDFGDEAKIQKCKCGGLIRPDVVWFGEYLPEDQYSSSEKAVKEADIFFIVGTSAVVYPAASLIYVAKQYRSFIIEINIEETEATQYADRSYFGESGKILPQLYEKISAAL